MRYTIDAMGYPDSDLPHESPVVVEILGPDQTVRPLRDHAGNVVGGSIGGEVGRARLRLIADEELLERITPLCNALRDLDEHMIALHTVHHADGSEPESAEEEAEIRTGMRFDALVAHAVMAVEIVTAQD